MYGLVYAGVSCVHAHLRFFQLACFCVVIDLSEQHMEQKNDESKSNNKSSIFISDSETSLAGNNSDQKNKNNKDKSTSKLNSSNDNKHMKIFSLSKSSGWNSNVKEYLNNNNTSDDTASVFSDMSGFTGYVSTIASSEYELNDALVAIIGISEYDGLPNLDGVIKDYENVIKTFSRHWKYNILFQLKNNKYIYTDDIKTLKLKKNKDYKLKWNGDDMANFVEVTRKHIVQQKHNGLIFVISSHGDCGRIMYDSDCEEYELDAIFGMYQPIGSQFIESYNETQEESNYLAQIPKIFVLDMCRGNVAAKPVPIVPTVIQTKIHKQTQVTQATKTNENESVSQENCDKQKNNGSISSDEEMKINHNKNKEHKQQQAQDIAKTSNAMKKEVFTVKGVSKDEASQLAGQESNFFKIYGTPEGYAVADGALHGGLFLRNFCKVFKDKGFISNHYWNDVVLKIREYTKREATINSNLLQFTQIVETEGTLEKKLKFFNKMEYNESKSVDIGDVDDTVPRKLLITNISDSSHKICALVEHENSSEDRNIMLNNLSNDKSLHLFKKYKFKTVESNGGGYEFVKPYSDQVFVTMFVIGDDSGNDNATTESKTEDAFNVELYDRFETREDYLYFHNDLLNSFVDLRLKCNVNDKHYLVRSRISNSTNTGLCKDCGNSTASNYCDYSFVCRRCKYELCQHCCHKMVLEKYVNKSWKAKNDDNDEQKHMTLDNINMMDKSKGNKQEQKASSGDHVNKNDWKFNFHYDYWNKGSKIHGIVNNGKTMKCDCNDVCYCFSTISNNGMKPNSGIYTIKLKINKIDDAALSENIIGITSEKYDNDHEKLRNNEDYHLSEDSNNYIGWSACDFQYNDVRNGLYCGQGDNSRKSNIFRKNNFVYQSKNDNYKDNLCGYKTGDILILSYNSDLNQLSFRKENDNGKLNSFIKNLPKNMIFYWFVAHWGFQPILYISIVD